MKNKPFYSENLSLLTLYEIHILSKHKTKDEEFVMLVNYKYCLTIGLLMFLLTSCVNNPASVLKNNLVEVDDDIHLSFEQKELDEIYSQMAYAVVYKDWQKKSKDKRGHNIGSVLVDGRGEIVHWARNCNNITKNSTMHGEVRVMQGYINKLGSNGAYLSGYTIYTTLEPCAQCSGMMVLTKLNRAVYGQSDSSYGKAVERLNLDSSKMTNGFTPYPDRPNYNRVISNKSNDMYGDKLDKAFRESGLKSITGFLLTTEAESIFREATNSFLNHKIKYSENEGRYSRALEFYKNHVADNYSPLPAMSIPNDYQVKSNSLDDATRSYAFQVNNGHLYYESELENFIQLEIRGRLSRTSNSRFQVKLHCLVDNASIETLVIEMEPRALYLENIDGVELSEKVSRYTNDNIVLSRKNFEKQFFNALNFHELSIKEKQDSLKMLAFIIAESARFRDIEKAVTKIYKENCKFDWKDYMLLVRRWKTMSIFANSRGIQGVEPDIGGWKAFLLAPISEEVVMKYDKAARDGWYFIRYDYDKQVRDRPTNIPDEDQCSM